MGKAKELVELLEERRRKAVKRNVTLSLDESVYEDAKKYLKAKDLKISDVVEAFLKEILGRK